MSWIVKSTQVLRGSDNQLSIRRLLVLFFCVGNIELRAQNPFDPTQFEKTLDVTVSEKESKSYLNVGFNKIETLSDCEAYFTGLKFTFANLATV